MHQNFIERVKQVILKHLEEENFGVIELASEIGLSRSQLLRKVKSNTGLSAKLYIRQIKLEEARKLMDETDLTISEIAYRVGFSSPPYFNKCFLKQYGLTPGEYKKGNGDLPNFAQNSNTKLSWKWIALFIGIILVGVVDYFITKGNNSKLSNNPYSIVVLPITDLSANNDFEYLADGITDAITCELSKYSEIRVISRTSAMNYKNVEKLSSEIADELNVNLILEGSIFFNSDSLHLIVQLIEPAPLEKHIWAKSYNHQYANLLRMASTVSNDIMNNLNLHASNDSKENEVEKVNTQAYTYYLKGRHLKMQQNPKAIAKAQEYLRESIRLDSTFALAYIALAETYQSLNRFINDREQISINREVSRDAVHRAIELDNKLGSAYIAEANLAGRYDWDWRKMKRMAERGLELEPNNAIGHKILSDYHVIKGNKKEALNDAIIANQLDPLNPSTGCLVADRYFLIGDYDQAVVEYQKVLELYPNYGLAWDGLGFVYFQNGDKEEALNCWRNLHENLGNHVLAQYYSQSSFREGLNYWLESAKGPSPQFCSNPTMVASVYMMLDENSKALHYLEVAHQNKNAELPWILTKPYFYKLSNEPRFKNLVEKIEIEKVY